MTAKYRVERDGCSTGLLLHVLVTILALVVLALSLVFVFSNQLNTLHDGTVARFTALASTLADVQTNLTAKDVMLQASLMEALMNVTALQPSVTVLKAGTFDWRFTKTPYPDVTVSGNTYTLENVRLGPLNFTLGIFSPPRQPLTMPNFGSSTRYDFYMENFDPPIVVVSQSYTLEYPLTDANRLRVLTTSGCLLTLDCYIYESIVFHNYVANTPGSSTFILTIHAPVASSTASENFTLSEPLQLLFPEL